MLIESGFPLNTTKSDGVTALIISCRREIEDENKNISKMLVIAGADINWVTDEGESALSQAINFGNDLLSDFLMR